MRVAKTMINYRRRPEPMSKQKETSILSLASMPVQIAMAPGSAGASPAKSFAIKRSIAHHIALLPYTLPFVCFTPAGRRRSRGVTTLLSLCLLKTRRMISSWCNIDSINGSGECPAFGIFSQSCAASWSTGRSGRVRNDRSHGNHQRTCKR